MKKLFLTMLLVASMIATSQAQDISKAIGARLGWGAEFSYQHPLSSNNRMEFDLGLDGWGNHQGFLLSGIYHWVFNIDGGLNWYIGPGLQLGSAWNADDDKYGLGLGVAGQVGLEYDFDIPLQLSMDWRPSWLLVPTGRSFGYEGVSLGIRYRF
ncbi:conserved exported hypothetical protein [uncultured Paludibacter sp.]|uniref:Secreted protein n=1 Tax=uncultured Paludibacter sp. TaxID=497635 RepID=A0A653AK12_9BACT|nr:conserved exported hypothetical protein [uncultured Paludibacter sp.]